LKKLNENGVRKKGGFMNFKVWCKSFLHIYHIIPNIISSIDKLILLKSANSSYFGDGSKSSTLNQIEGIIDLSQRKINLINLKVLTDETLLDMNKQISKLLVIRYINNVNCKKAIELSGFSRRTYFRNLNKALNEFEKVLYKKVLNNKSIYKSFLKESFLEDIFMRINIFETQVKDEDEFASSKFSNKICSFIINKMKKVI
jgi:hypothetical protein